MNLDEKKKFLINCSYFFLIFVIIFLLFKVGARYLFPFIIAFFIAYCVQKPAKILSQKTKIKLQICATILSVVFYIFFVAAIVFFGWILYNCANVLIKLLSDMGDITYQIGNVTKYIDKIFVNLDYELQYTLKRLIDETGSNFISKISNYLSGWITSFAKKIPGLLFSGVVTVVATCYISKDFDKLKMFIKGLLNDNLYKKIVDIKSVFTECFFKIIVGYCKLFGITFVMLLVGLLLIGTSQFFVFAFLIAIVDILPVLGAGTVLLPWAVFSFVQYDYKMGFSLIMLYIIIVVVKNFVEPKIIAKQIGINPLFTLIFMFLGLRLGGVLGMIMLPIFLTVTFTYYRRQVINN